MSYLDGVRENVISMLAEANETALEQIIKILNRQSHGSGSPRGGDGHLTSPGGARGQSTDSTGTALPSLDFGKIKDQDGSTIIDLGVPSQVVSEYRPNVVANLFGGGGSQPNSGRNGPKPEEVVHASVAAPGPAGDASAGLPTSDNPLEEDIQSGQAAPKRANTQRRAHRRIAISNAPSLGVDQAKNFKPRFVAKSDEEKLLCRKGVAACHLFSSLDEDDQITIVDAMAKEEFPAGHDVLKQGSVTTSRFYLIAEGTTNVVKSGKIVAILAEGSTFGELEMMYDSAENAATVRTVTPCVMFTLDRETYKNMVVHISIAKRELYVGLLKQVSFLERMNEYDRNQLADALTPATFQPNDYIISFGERGEWMHFILEGQVEVMGRDKGKKVSIVKLGKGEIVGELEFLFDHLTVADVIALTKVKTAKLNRKHFEMCMGPITDDLKRMVAKGKYEHYLSVIDSSVHKQIKALEQKQEGKRVAGNAAAGQQSALGVVDRDGEIIIQAALDASAPDRSMVRGSAGLEGPPTALYRFPLLPVQETDLIMIGLREDGTVMLWNDVIARITNYSAEEAVGQSFYSFLHKMKEQRMVNEAVQSALSWVGNIDGFFGAVAGLGKHQSLKPEALLGIPQSARSDGKGGSHGAAGATATGGANPLSDANAFDTATGEDGAPAAAEEVDEKTKLTRLRRNAQVALRRLTQTYTFARSDGLSKSQVQLAILPSLVAQSGDVPNMVIAVGTECKEKSTLVDHTTWLREQLKLATTIFESGSPPNVSSPVAPLPPTGTLPLPETAAKAFSQTVKSLLDKYDNLVKFGSEDNNLQRVNLRHMIMQVESGFNGDAMARGNEISTIISDDVSGTVLCDAKVLPEVLRYALSNCVKHCSSCKIFVRAKLATDMGIDYIEIEFEDTGPGIPEKVLQAFNNPTGSSLAVAGTMLRVRSAVAKLGGSMKVKSEPRHTVVTFRFPFAPCEDDSDDEEEEEKKLEGADITMSASMAHDASASVHAKGSSTSKAKRTKHHFTTLVVEEKVIHRNMLSAFLWERKHAVLPATTWSDVERLIESSDIVIIDPQQRMIAANVDIITYLRQQLSSRSIIITGETFDDETRQAYDKYGFLTLTKPCTVIQALSSFRRAEESAMKHINAREQIKATREAFTKTNRGKLTRGQLLGKGSFGEVYEAVDVLTGGRMAVKCIRKQDNMNIAELKNEIETMCRLHHKNIIHYFFCEEEETSLNVYMEFAAGGTLQGLLAKQGGKGLERKELIRVVREVVEGVKYVHDQGYVHSDLKTANVLLSADGTCKIGDFGTAKKVGPDGKLHVMEGTPLYMSPECMCADEENGFDFKTDIWSLGWIVFELALGKAPYSNVGGLTPTGLMKHITSLCDSPDLSPLFDDPTLFEFVRACLDVRPDLRPTAAKLLEFNLLNGSDDEGGALAALKKAQLLHILERFVAFQEPVDEKEAEIEAKLKALADRGNKGPRRSSGDFFDSDDDDAGGFFDSDDDDDDDDDDSKKKKKGKKHGEDEGTTAGKPAAPTAAVPNHGSDDDDGPPTHTKATAAAAAAPSVGTNASDATTTVPPLKPRPPPTPPHRATMSHPPTPPRSPTSTGESKAMERSALADTDANRDAAIIALHDALWNLIDVVRRTVHVDMGELTNPLEAQYKKLRATSGAEDAADVKPSSSGEQVAAPARRAMTPSGEHSATNDGGPLSPTGGGRFKPNVTEVLRHDTELTSTVSRKLLQLQKQQ